MHVFQSNPICLIQTARSIQIFTSIFHCRNLYFIFPQSLQKTGLELLCTEPSTHYTWCRCVLI